MSSEVAALAARSGTVTGRGAATAERVIRPEFTGSAGEYFRIWIVNLFFTLITLGIYSAWAKVRKKRYFYGSIRLDGDTFDYFASPKTILKGRIVAILVFVVYAFAAELYPSSALAFWAAFLLVLPWLVMRALTFNARNSAYRGLRFDFAAAPREAVRVYIGMPLVVGLTLGLAFPWFMARQKAFVLSHHALGTTRFGCDVSAREFFGIYILATIILLALLVPAAGLMGFAIASQALPEAVSWLGFVVPAVLMYAAYAAVYAFIQARTTNLLWNGAHGPGIRFSSSLGAARLARLYIGNVVAIAATAGLLIPWAVVRTLRYRLENLAMHVLDEAPHEANPSLERVGATGQELGDIFNLDLGI
ncbi:MAG TPA: YjgN family protein [Burkholderiales bacterium]